MKNSTLHITDQFSNKLSIVLLAMGPLFITPYFFYDSSWASKLCAVGALLFLQAIALYPIRMQQAAYKKSLISISCGLMTLICTGFLFIQDGILFPIALLFMFINITIIDQQRRSVFPQENEG